ncbi:hypothetical protein F0L74_11720 [Chitinophaga agrisoli]|uniref:Uncharacterized protein n=1 Tax=Chitinophaga agrisoli TaxID=2607653 RepID=A0A5B2VYD2_9BACT|nr:hypothetical protein [Chitinophaga agrisoli]KAA2243176.1 hypothetical protein F0L74_11720 [Chitinophaga agrisoli]
MKKAVAGIIIVIFLGGSLLIAAYFYISQLILSGTPATKPPVNDSTLTTPTSTVENTTTYEDTISIDEPQDHMPIDSVISMIDPRYAKKELKAFIYPYNDTLETVFIEDSLKNLSCKLYFLSNITTIIDDTLKPANANNLLAGIKEKKAVLLLNENNIPWEGATDDVDMIIPNALLNFNYNGQNCLLFDLYHMAFTPVGSYPVYLLLVLDQQKQVTYQVRIDEPLTPELLKEYLSPEQRESNQIIDLFKSKNADAILDHCGFPFLLRTAEGGDTAGIADGRILKTRLNDFLTKDDVKEFFAGRKRVDVHEHTISYEVRDYNQDGELESESDLVFYFRKNGHGKIELYQIVLAG